MKKILVLAMLSVSSIALYGCSQSSAADLSLYKATPAPAYIPFSWNGLYVDGYFLYGANITNTTVAGGTTLANLAATPHGPGVGGALGYWWDTGPFVLGVRANIAYANLTGSGQINTLALNVSNATNYLGDFDGCIGLPLSPDRHLLGYGCGGFGFGGAHPNLQVATLSQAINDTSTGAHAAAGLKYMFTNNWGLFIEGNYYDLGGKSITIPANAVLATPAVTSSAKYNIITQTVGVTYKF